MIEYSPSQDGLEHGCPATKTKPADDKSVSTKRRKPPKSPYFVNSDTSPPAKVSTTLVARQAAKKTAKGLRIHLVILYYGAYPELIAGSETAPKKPPKPDTSGINSDSSDAAAPLAAIAKRATPLGIGSNVSNKAVNEDRSSVAADPFSLRKHHLYKTMSVDVLTLTYYQGSRSHSKVQRQERTGKGKITEVDNSSPEESDARTFDERKYLRSQYSSNLY